MEKEKEKEKKEEEKEGGGQRDTKLSAQSNWQKSVCGKCVWMTILEVSNGKMCV